MGHLGLTSKVALIILHSKGTTLDDISQAQTIILHLHVGLIFIFETSSSFIGFARSREPIRLKYIYIYTLAIDIPKYNKQALI